MKFFDVHTHIQFEAFKDDLDEVIKRAREAGVSMINVGTQIDTSVSAIELAENNEGLRATVGLHPIHTSKSFHDEQELGGGEAAKAFTSRGEEFDYEFYKNLALNPKVVAIGECGLDYYRNINQELGIKKQEEVFRKQIELATELKKPLMIHCREAFGDLISILNSYFLIHNSQNPGVIHFFSGTTEDAKALMNLGFSFSFGGVITFTRDYDDLVRYIELDRILLETDAPYVAPIPYRGKRNEPSYVIEVAKKISQIKNIELEEVAGKTFENARTLFLEKNP